MAKTMMNPCFVNCTAEHSYAVSYTYMQRASSPIQIADSNATKHDDRVNWALVRDVTSILLMNTRSTMSKSRVGLVFSAEHECRSLRGSWGTISQILRTQRKILSHRIRHGTDAVRCRAVPCRATPDLE